MRKQQESTWSPSSRAQARFLQSSNTVEKRGDRTALIGITDGYNLSAAFAKGCSKGISQDLGPNDGPSTIEDTDPEAIEQVAWLLTW